MKPEIKQLLGTVERYQRDGNVLLKSVMVNAFPALAAELRRLDEENEYRNDVMCTLYEEIKVLREVEGARMKPERLRKFVNTMIQDWQGGASLCDLFAEIRQAITEAADALEQERTKRQELEAKLASGQEAWAQVSPAREMLVNTNNSTTMTKMLAEQNGFRAVKVRIIKDEP